MSSPFIGEIRMFGGNFAPAGWAFCNGALIPIAENDALFNLIGTTYGGDGQTTFALPNLQSRVPIHVGPGFVQGQTGGTETVTLIVNQIPSHSHVPQAQSAAGTAASPSNAVWANSSLGQFDNANPPVRSPPRVDRNPMTTWFRFWASTLFFRCLGFFRRRSSRLPTS